MRDYYLSIIFGKRTGWIASFLCALLRLCSWIYAGIVFFMRWAYQKNILRSYDLACPVISVGNITWGGVGKTPIVEWLVNECLVLNRNPVVLMRGYMTEGSLSRESSDSDEAQLLSDAFQGRVPVIVEKDRVQGALKVPGDYAHDLFILDDGFQHWRVKRGLDILAIDTMNPFGNGAVLPRGILREPMRALKNADIFILTKADLGEKNIPMIRSKLSQYCPGVPVVEAVHQPYDFYDLREKKACGLSSLEKQSAILASGIGSPEGFEQTVNGLGVDVKGHVIFPDHFSYGPLDIEKIVYQLEHHQVFNLIITAKDAVKLDPLSDQFPVSVRIFVLQVKVVILKGEEVLQNAIRTFCHH